MSDELGPGSVEVAKAAKETLKARKVAPKAVRWAQRYDRGERDNVWPPPLGELARAILRLHTRIEDLEREVQQLRVAHAIARSVKREAEDRGAP